MYNKDRIFLSCIACLSLILMMSFTSAYADEKADLLLGQWTNHIDKDFNYNESHNLVGVEYSNWAVARFKNSYDKTSWAVMRSHQVSSNWKIAYGASTGYEGITGMVLTPIVMLSYNMGILDVNFMPDIGTGVGFRFKTEW